MEDLRQRIEGFVESLASSRHRRLIYVAPERLEELGWAAERLGELKPGARILLAYRQPGDPLVQRLREMFGGSFELSELQYQETGKVLGTTWDGLVADVTLQLKPNDLGVLVELVRGGGPVILVGPGVGGVEAWTTDFHRDLAVYPYTVKDVAKRFERRLLSRTIGRPGTLYLDGERSVFGPEPPEPPKPSGPGGFGEVFPRELYEMCLTLDEARVLRALEGFTERGRRSLIITANRGRGKSAALGLGIAGLITMRPRKRRVREVVITAPEPINVQTLFEFISQGVRRLGYEPEVEERDGLVTGLRVRGAQAYYRSPYAVTRLEGEMAVVDEASGVPVPVLFAIRRRFRKTVYSATIHGYEGAGRGFNVRFLGRIRREWRGGLTELEMTEPVRYAPGDPVEKWLYEALLLDAEPAQLSQEEAEEAVRDPRYVKADLDEWFDSSENLLRQFVGIYVLTHYRNRPDDLALLGDAPHHRARALVSPGGKVVAAVQLCYEGGLPREVVSEMGRVQPRGHMIPSVVARYYPHLKGFGMLKGARIVRIAVHPELWGRGLGSRILGEVVEELSDQGVEWVGSGFGASPELLRFWFRNGFAPIHVGPVRNPVSGEFSVIVVKPLSREAEKILSEISREFRIRFLECLPDPYFNMERDLSWLLLSKTIGEYRAKAEFKGSQRLRLQSYMEYAVTYEGASDAIKSLVKAHFLTSAEKRVGIGEVAEKLLIMKVLQGRPWANVAGQLNMKSGELRELMRELVEKLLKYYG